MVDLRADAIRGHSHIHHFPPPFLPPVLLHFFFLPLLYPSLLSLFLPSSLTFPSFSPPLSSFPFLLIPLNPDRSGERCKLPSGGRQRISTILTLVNTSDDNRFCNVLQLFNAHQPIQWRRKQFASGGAQYRREAPAEIFLMCPLTFLLCPPHEGAQRLFVTD